MRDPVPWAPLDWITLYLIELQKLVTAKSGLLTHPWCRICQIKHTLTPYPEYRGLSLAHLHRVLHLIEAVVGLCSLFGFYFCVGGKVVFEETLYGNSGIKMCVSVNKKQVNQYQMYSIDSYRLLIVI